MRQKIGNLTERNGKYYFRSLIPKNFVAPNCNKEIRVSLHTTGQ